MSERTGPPPLSGPAAAAPAGDGLQRRPPARPPPGWPTRLPWGACRPARPLPSFLPSPFPFSFLFHPFRFLPDRSSPSPASPRSLLFSFPVARGDPTRRIPNWPNVCGTPGRAGCPVPHGETKSEVSRGVQELRTRVPGQRGNSKLQTPQEHVILRAAPGKAAKTQKGRRTLSNERDTTHTDTEHRRKIGLDT